MDLALRFTRLFVLVLLVHEERIFGRSYAPLLFCFHDEAVFIQSFVASSSSF